MPWGWVVEDEGLGAGRPLCGLCALGAPYPSTMTVQAGPDLVVRTAARTTAASCDFSPWNVCFLSSLATHRPLQCWFVLMNIITETWVQNCSDVTIWSKHNVIFTHQFAECPLSPWHPAGAWGGGPALRSFSLGLGGGIDTLLRDRRTQRTFPGMEETCLQFRSIGTQPCKCP